MKNERDDMVSHECIPVVAGNLGLAVVEDDLVFHLVLCRLKCGNI